MDRNKNNELKTILGHKSIVYSHQPTYFSEIWKGDWESKMDAVKIFLFRGIMLSVPTAFLIILLQIIGYNISESFANTSTILAFFMGLMECKYQHLLVRYRVIEQNGELIPQEGHTIGFIYKKWDTFCCGDEPTKTKDEWVSWISDIKKNRKYLIEAGIRQKDDFLAQFKYSVVSS